MGRIFRIIDEAEDYRNNQRGYNQKESDMLERAFKEGCDYGYKKAMKEMQGYNEKNYNGSEGFEEKIERLKRKYE